MIHGDREYQRVESLIAVMAQALRMIETSAEPCDPELKTLLRDSYHAHTQALRIEQEHYERRRTKPRERAPYLTPLQSGGSLDSTQRAERQIDAIEGALDDVRARVTELECGVPLNHDRLKTARAELELHEGLLAEWQEYEDELLRSEGEDQE